MRRLTFLILGLSFISVSLQGVELKWRKYANARFGFVLTYPETLIAGPESTNGDGRKFHSADGEFSLLAFAHFFVPGIDSFEQRWQEELDSPGVTITYKRRTPTWYVVSGVTKNGTEYYHKLYRKGANWAAFHITYLHAKNKRFDSWVSRIEKSFVPFREGDFDRLE